MARQLEAGPSHRTPQIQCLAPLRTIANRQGRQRSRKALHPQLGITIMEVQILAYQWIALIGVGALRLHMLRCHIAETGMLEEVTTEGIA